MSTTTREYRNLRSDLLNRYISQGRVEGEAMGVTWALLQVLDARGITVPDDARAYIVECSDLTQLERWVRRAAVAGSVYDLFTEQNVGARAKGKAESLLVVLSARGITVPDDVRARITDCFDLSQLETWIAQAVTAESIDDLLGLE